jgi:hypothetical protein
LQFLSLWRLKDDAFDTFLTIHNKSSRRRRNGWKNGAHRAIVPYNSDKESLVSNLGSTAVKCGLGVIGRYGAPKLAT